MVSFCKKRGCPASQEILAFSSGSIGVESRDAIDLHFCECEFCVAELEFYTHYPQAADIVEFEEIPQPLYELATSLLGSKTDLTPLYKLMSSGAK
ncbi:MAG TPA: hypothetical protein VGQ55_13460 [Pyrinomonadaceae bacterium]|jgi:hypothetical protein|nr:hypothetical protein [Pyrinomonadaceae bacterium]